MTLFERPRCEATGKIIYETREFAKAEIGRLRSEIKANARKVYRCAFCEKYHATSGRRGNSKGKP